MTPEQQKEEISKAYIQTVAARCGFKVGTWSQDDDCLDVTIGSAGVLGGGTLASPKIDLQIKCTSDPAAVHPDDVTWQLDRRHYDRLIARSHTPKLLVVLVLPEDETQWIEHTIDHLILRRCAYWLKMTGLPPISTDSKVVHLPQAQVFSPAALQSLMERLSREEAL